MTTEELAEIGLDDAALEKSYKKHYSETVSIPRGNSEEATAKRQDVYKAVCAAWYA